MQESGFVPSPSPVLNRLCPVLFRPRQIFRKLLRGRFSIGNATSSVCQMITYDDCIDAQYTTKGVLNSVYFGCI